MFATQQMDLPAGNVGNSKSLNTTRPRVQILRAAWHCYVNVAILISIKILTSIPQLYQSARLPEFPHLTCSYRWNYTRGGIIPYHSNIIPYHIPCHGMAMSYHTHTIHTISYTIPWYGHIIPYHSYHYHTIPFTPYHIPYHGMAISYHTIYTITIPYHWYHTTYHTMVWPYHAIPFIPYHGNYHTTPFIPYHSYHTIPITIPHTDLTIPES